MSNLEESEDPMDSHPHHRKRFPKKAPVPIQKWVKGQIVRCWKRFGHVTDASHGQVVVTFPHKERKRPAEIITFRHDGRLLGGGEVVLFNNECKSDVLDSTCIALNELLREVDCKLQGDVDFDNDEEEHE